MAGCSQYVKFFRFRSPAYVSREGGLEESLWLFRSLEYIDFDWKALIEESQFVSWATKGGFNYQILRDMNFDEYEYAIEKAKDLIPKGSDDGQ